MSSSDNNPRSASGQSRIGRSGVALVLCVSCALSAPVFAQLSTPRQTDEYTIGPLDVLNITVWKQPDLSGTFSVGSDGGLMFPLVGRLHAGGLSRRDVEAALRARLADGYLREPQVTVTVEQYRSQRVFVTGEVRQPGAIALSGPLSLLECLARAGSTTDHAGHEAIVARPPGGSDKSGPAPFDATSEIIRVDIRELQRGILTHNVALRDGDTVFIPRAPTVHVMGQIKSAGEYRVFHGTTVAEIVSRAGGVSERGSIGRIRVIRTIDGKKKELKVDFDDLLQPGDIVVVRERVF